MKPKLKQNLMRTAILLPVCLVVLSLILNQQGVIHLAFLSKNESDLTTGNPAVSTAADITSDYTETEPSGSEIVTEPFSPYDDLTYDEVMLRLVTATEANDAGYTRSAGDYQSGTTVIAALDSSALPKSYETEDGVACFYGYLGTLLYRNDGKTSMLDGTGKVLFSGVENFSLPYLRDSEGHALFELNGVYYYLTRSGKMVSVEMNPAFTAYIRRNSAADYGKGVSDRVRFALDNPTSVYYADDGSDITASVKEIFERLDRLQDEEYQKITASFKLKTATKTATIEDYISYFSWKRLSYDKAAEKYGIQMPNYTETVLHDYRYGYRDENGTTVIEPQYAFASEFGENGYAMVANKDGVVQIIDRSGNVVLDPSSDVLFLPARNNRPAYDGYYLPETVGDESQLGMFYFDHGLIRIRRVITDYYKRETILREEDLLLRADGSYFDIPEGYELVAYNEGILLLERDGLFGYLDVKGHWICQPELVSATPFDEGMAVVGYENGKKALIGKTGEIILPAVFDEIQNGTDGLILTYEAEHGWQIFWKMERGADKVDVNPENPPETTEQGAQEVTTETPHTTTKAPETTETNTTTRVPETTKETETTETSETTGEAETTKEAEETRVPETTKASESSEPPETTGDTTAEEQTSKEPESESESREREPGE